MIFDYSKMEKTVLHQFKGGKKDTLAQMYVDDNNRIMRGSLEPGASIGLHRHETNSEIIFILSGHGQVLENDGNVRDIYPGNCHYCPRGEEHSLMNNSDTTLTFYAVVPNHK